MNTIIILLLLGTAIGLIEFSVPILCNLNWWILTKSIDSKDGTYHEDKI